MFALADSEFRPELALVVRLVQEAGAEVMRFYKRNLAVTDKNNHTPVTEADYAAEEIIIRSLRAAFPYPILSEEKVQDAARRGSEYVWLVDPLDGTGSFARGEESFAVLIGLCRNNKPLLGAAYFPPSDTVYFAERGKGAYQSEKGSAPRRMRVSENGSLAQARVLLSDKTGSAMEELFKRAGVGEVIRIGGFAGKAVIIASGRADLYLNVSRKGSEWDTCAVEVILEEAGGVITDLYNRPLAYNQADVRRLEGEAVSANAALHAEIMGKFGKDILQIHAATTE